MKKYSFAITSGNFLNDEKTPITFVEFEFLADNKEKASKFRESLYEHYENNKPLTTSYPKTMTDLIESDYSKK